jgi:hypothetical protein
MEKVDKIWQNLLVVQTYRVRSKIQLSTDLSSNSLCCKFAGSIRGI